MNKKTITINDKDYPVEFTLKTITLFEEIVEKSFFETNFSKTTDRIALIYAAVEAASPKHDLTVDTIMGDYSVENLKAISAAFSIISDLATDFFDEPKVTEDKEIDKIQEGEKPKN